MATSVQLDIGAYVHAFRECPRLDGVESIEHPECMTAAIKTPAPPPPDADATVQVVVRIPRAWLSRADALGAEVVRHGGRGTRSAGLRLAMSRGFEVLEGEETKRPSK